MGRFIVGGYGQDVTFKMEDKVCRAIQNVVLTRLSDGKGLFFRSAGERDGAEVQSTVWISPSTAVRFEYDVELFPELNEGLAATYDIQVEKFGGIILPSNAEIDSWGLDKEPEAAQT